MFWLSSRYYSPELCRFISPDDASYLDLESVNGLNLYCYCFNEPVNYIDPDGHFPWLVLAIISGVLIAGGATLGGVSAYQSGRDVGTGILEGAFAGAMMAGSMWLMVGSFYVQKGLGSNLGLMMFTYGFNTMAGMTEAGATQIRYSISQGDHWSSNLTRSLAANAPSIYTTKAIPKMLPFATQFSWHIGEKFAYTIPGEGGVFYDYRTTKDAWGMFKNYLGKTPTLFSYGFAAYGILRSLRGIYNSIWGTPNYDKWIVF